MNAPAIYKNQSSNVQGIVLVLGLAGIAFVLYKVLGLFGKATTMVSDTIGTTNKDKEEIFTNEKVTDNLKWLDSGIASSILVKSKYKTSRAYLTSINFPFESLGRVADQVWNAKMPFYIDEGAVYAAISSLPSKVAIGTMAWIFNYRYAKKFNGMTLSDFLGKYLKSNELSTVATIISKKPEF